MTWSDILRIGLGQCGLDPISLFNMTFDEFQAAVQGKRETLEAMERENWERVRWQTATLLQPNIKKGKRLTPRMLLPFPWEKVETAAPSKEELQASLERIKNRDKDKWQS